MNKILLCFILLAGFSFSQTTIKGKVFDDSKNPLPSANIYIKSSYDGATSDSSGNFKFTTSEKGKVVLGASFIGYKSFEKTLDITNQKTIDIDIILSEEMTTLNTVVVSAGFFEASDEKKSVILRPLDIVTTGSQADIYAALNTLPGAQQIGEQEGLFVRGGDAVESKVFIDELLVNKPFFSPLPDIPSRGRFSAFYFKGTMFSTGGYSAQYGQALSSALILKTEDMPERSFTAISLMAVGFGFTHLQKWDSSALSAEVNYYNLGPYFKIIPQRQRYETAPVSGDLNIMYRLKPTKTGMLKFYGYYNASDTKLYVKNIDALNLEDKIFIKNKDSYLNANYKDLYGDWTVFVGTSYNYDQDKIDLNSDKVTDENNVFSGKATILKSLGHFSALTFGGEFTSLKYKESYNIYSQNLLETNSAAFLEGDFVFTKNIAARIGGRYEYSRFINKSSLAPRISFAYKLNKFGQFNFAYGKFYQTPERIYLFQTDKLNFENAEHFILNYQYLEDDINFRIEGYYKKYKDLVKGNIPYARGWEDFTVPQNIYIGNYGKGYAKGIDVFWRDRKNLSNVDYWISYSYLDTKRDFRNYQTMAVPPFAAKHTASFVLKHYVESISTSFGLTYTFATGRTYYNPNNPAFLTDRTRDYNSFSINAAYLTYIGSNYTIIFMSIDNPFGFSNIYGYRYSSDGQNRMAIVPTSMRTAFIGIFINFEH